jgi:hypothetical protein
MSLTKEEFKEMVIAFIKQLMNIIMRELNNIHHQQED